ncbi:MAG: TonB-dependent receptor [Blastocatellia bacterium]|nr:TonB-dependent receptor [Blastocatellia bacterium]
MAVSTTFAQSRESAKLTIAFVLLTLALLSVAAFAQQTTGNVRGLIKDPTGATVANAKITVLDKKTNAVLTIQSTGAGEYEFKNLLPGDYQVTIDAQGFKKATVSDVRVQLNQTTDLNVILEVGVQSESVEVSAGGAELVDTTTTNLSKSFSSQQVIELAQTATGAGIYNLALIAPNISTSGGVGVGTGGSVGGQRPRNNNFVVDGIDNNDKSVTGPQVYISPESVAEFSLLQNQYSAEFARSTGGQFITVTKSGTNDFHGSAYSFFQNRHLNALDNQDILKGITRCYTVGDSSCMPRFDFARAGFNLGGPLYLPTLGKGGRSSIGGKDKLFFFVGYERMQNGAAASANGIQTPTAAGFAMLDQIAGPAGFSATNLGIFKQYVPTAPTQGVDKKGNPSTICIQFGGDCTVDPTTGVQSGTLVPVGNVNIPSPNFNYNNYIIANVDFVQSEQTQHRFRFNFNQNRGIDTAATFPQFFQLVPTDTRLFSYTLTHSFTSRLSNEARLAYRRYNSNTLVGNQQFQGLDQFPNIQLGDLSVNIGPDPNAPQFGIENNYQFVDTLSYLLGNHSTKFGVDLRKLISPQSFVQRQRGDYEYTNTGTFLFDQSPDIFGERTVGASPYEGNQMLLFAFAQDDWRIRPNFTLNLGVNYAYQQVPFSARQQGVNAISTVPGVLDFREPTSQKKNFAPRIGIAYSPNYNSGVLGFLFGNGGKSSIRAGFSMAYDVIFDNLYILSLPPQFNQTNDVDTTAPPTANFLANGGLSPVPVPVTDPATARAVTSAFIQDQKVPYSITYTLSIQREFLKDWSFEVRYLGTRGVHLLTQNQINRRSLVNQNNALPMFTTAPTQAEIDAMPNTLQNLISQGRVVPAFAAAGFSDPNVPITSYLSNGNSSYHAFSAQLTRRLTKGLQMTGAYTYSHLIDDSTAEVFSTVLTPRRQQDFQNLGADRATSALDHRQRFALSALYDLPFFSKSSNKLTRSLLGGFSLAGTYGFELGEPATVTSAADSNLNGDSAGDRSIFNPNGVPGTASTAVPLLKTCPASGILDDGTCDPNLTPSRTVGYFIPNPNAQYIQAGRGTVATAGRNTVTLPSINDLDFSVFKNFQITETVKIQFRTDFYNAFNHPQYVPGAVNGVQPIGQTSNAASALYGIGLNSTLFNRPDLVFSSHPRVVQMALRLNF